MALSKNKQAILDRFSTVLANLDEKSEGDKAILQGMYQFLGGCIRSAELAAESTVTSSDEPSFEEGGEEGGEEASFGDEETASSDEPSFDDGEEASFGEEGTEEAASDEEPSFGEEEAAADEEPSFGEEEPAPAKPARTAKPAEPADPYDAMSVQDIINVLKEAGADMEKVKAAHSTEKKAGVVKFAKKIDALSANWTKYLTKATVAQAEKVAASKGVTVKYPRGRSDDAKKKGIIANALAARFIPIPVKK